jgi:UDP:flavonoid glycosyltransferase YjiC (YdhE family)
MKNKKILFAPDSISLAHVVRPLAASQHLKDYDVEFACDKKYHSMISQYGHIKKIYDLPSVDTALALKRIRQSSTIYDSRTLKRYIDADTEVINRSLPDLVVTGFRLSLNISAEICKKKCIYLSNAYWTRYYAGMKEAPSTFIATKIMGKKAANRFLPLVLSAAAKIYARPFNRIRKSLGFTPIRDIYDAMSSKILTCIMDIPEFMPCKNLPSYFKYVGPILWEPCENPCDPIKNLDFQRPTIYVNMGTTGKHESFQAVIDALGCSEYQVIIATGGQTTLKNYPENIYAAEFIPASFVLDRSVLVINHGGNVSSYQAFLHKKPVIGIPTFHDQEINAERTVELGLGLKIPLKNLKPAAIKTAVDKILSNHNYYKKNLARFSSLIEASNGAINTANLIKQAAQ